MCQAYMELGMTTKCLELLEVEQQKWESLPPPEKVAQEQKLIGLILTHWDALMQARRLCAPCLHWHGEGAYGHISYRTQDLPRQWVEEYMRLRAQYDQLAPEQTQRLAYLHNRIYTYIDQSPNAADIEQIISHVYRNERQQAAALLDTLRRNHPDYCPEPFRALSLALAATPATSHARLLLLCTRLPLGTTRETHIVD